MRPPHACRQAGANALHSHDREDPTLTLLHEACFLEDEDASLDIATQVLPTPPPLQQLPHRSCRSAEYPARYCSALSDTWLRS